MLVKNLTKKILAIALIFTLTFANFAVVTKAYAVSGIFDKVFVAPDFTGSKDVEFDAYFKSEETGEEKLESLEADVNDKDLKLYFDLNLLGKGYIKNSKISVVKSNEDKEMNFKISDGFENELVEIYEENEFALVKIDEESMNVIEVPIEYVSEKFIDLEKLSGEFKVIFEGVYVDEKAKEKELSREIELYLSWKDSKDATVESEITKFFQYTADGEKYSIIQTLVKVDTRTDKNVLPVKNIETKIALPKLGSGEITDITVVATSTEATNNKSNEEVSFGSDNIVFDEENNLIIIKTVNEIQKVVEESQDDLKEEAEIVDEKFFSGTGVDEYLVTYKIKNLDLVEDLNFKSHIIAQVITHTGIESENYETKIEKELEALYTVSEQTGENVSYKIENETENLSKGYMYLNFASDIKSELEYKTKSIFNISTPELIEELRIEDVENYYLGKDESKVAETNSYYKKISVSKENFNSILGENGKIEIFDINENVVATIDNTLEEINGYYEVKFEETFSKLSIKTSAPIDEGNLVINEVKAQTESSLNKKQYSQMASINQIKKATAKYKDVTDVADIATVNVETKLDDTKTKANLVLSTESLSTLVENKDVEIKIELNNQKAESDVYGNSVFEIEFPEYVRNLEITNSSIMYGEGLEISNVELLENNGRIYARVFVKGIQRKLSSGLLTNGTNIILNANIIVDEYAPAKEDEIKLFYSNEESTNYTTELVENMQRGLSAIEIKPIIYSAPKGVVSVNSISNYNEENSVIASIFQGIKKDTLEILTSSKNAKMELIVMNNSDEEISNLAILGRIPFKGVKDVISGEELNTTVDSKLLSTISQDDRNEVAFKVYYSENEEATKDLEDENNGWTENVQNLDNIKSYLIVPEDSEFVMENYKIIRFSYEYLIPENLEHNTNICSTFATYYINEENMEEVSGTDIVYLTTGEGPQFKIETTTSAEKIKEFEELTITTVLENTAPIDAKNVVLTMPLPEGSKYVKAEGKILPRIENNTAIFEMDRLEVGKKIEASVVVEMQEIGNESEVEIYSTVNAKDLAKIIESKKSKVKILNAEMKIEFIEDTANYFSKDTEIILKEGGNLNLKLKVQNLKDVALKNVVVNMNIDSSYKVKQVIKSSEIDSYQIDENNKLIWNFEKLEAGDYNTLILNVSLKDLEDGITKKKIVNKFTAKAEGTEEYTSLEEIVILGGAALEIKQTTDTVDTYIKEGNNIVYRYEVKNVGTVLAERVKIQNIVPKGLVIKQVEYNIGEVNSKKYIHEAEKFNLTLEIPAGQTANIIITALANSIGQAEELSVTNYATAKGTNTDEVVSNSITHIIEPKIIYNEKGEVVTGNNAGDTTAIEKTYKISGIAWLDENEDGIRTSSESKLSGITVKLIESATGVIKAKTTTNSNGAYSFTNVENGEYVVIFDYDSTLYALTKYQVSSAATNVNSDVTSTTVTQDGKQFIAAVTNTITVNNGSISNIDMGLVAADSFDLKLDKTVTKITVQNAKGTDTSTYNNIKLAKTEIASKYINSSIVYVEYSIKVSNVGDLAGYAKKIVDYLPGETTFNSGLNGNSAWYTGMDGNLYSTALADTLILPGQTKEIKLVLTKQMNEHSSSLISNTAEIYETYNVYGVKDKNSTAGNKIQNENDMSIADAIIGVKTGEVFIYTSVIISIMLCGGILVIVLYNKLVLKKRKEGAYYDKY